MKANSTQIPHIDRTNRTFRSSLKKCRFIPIFILTLVLSTLTFLSLETVPLLAASTHTSTHDTPYIISAQMIRPTRHTLSHNATNTEAEALAVAQAYQAFHKERFNQAAQISFDLIRTSQTPFKDPYFILANIHLNDNLYQVAVNYYEQALAHTGTFLIREHALLLHYNLSEAYYENKQPKRQIATLETLLTLATPEQGTFYQTYLSKAHFLLALAYWSFEDQAKSLYHLKAMLQNNYKTTIAHLLLAYYYAKTPQPQMTLDHQATLQSKNSLANDPDKKQLFNFYYEHFTQAIAKEPFSLQADNTTSLHPYLKFVETIHNYRDTILREIDAKRRADFEYLNDRSAQPLNPNKIPNTTSLFPSPSLNTPNRRATTRTPSPRTTTNDPTTNAPTSSLNSSLNTNAKSAPNSSSSPSYQRNQLKQNRQDPNQQDTINTFKNKIEELYRNNDTLLFLGNLKQPPPRSE